MAFRSGKIRVLLAMEEALLRSGVRLIVDEESDMEAFECRGRREASAACEEVAPDVVVLDYDGGSASEELLQSLSAGKARVVAMTADDDPELMLKALREGARGTAPCSASGRTLVEAARAVSRGLRWLTPDLERYCTEQRVSPADPEPEDVEEDWARLTEREKQIAKLVGQGLKQQGVAERLGISVHTVKNHMRRIFMKLNVSNRVELAVLGRERSRG